MVKLTAGIVAPVDAGKTTLSEALLYQAGTVRQLGRVDNGDAFLDSDALEKKRGITIFSHEAQLHAPNLDLTLLDTPGHVDFASQAEQVMPVLDAAILVVAAEDGIQGYTRTLWRLLAHYHVPTFIFVNKMDAANVAAATVLATLQQDFGAGCVMLPAADAPLSEAQQEAIAVLDDDVLSAYLDTGNLTEKAVRQLIMHRQVFPVYFGAALKLQGVTDILAGLARWGTPLSVRPAFGARVFKISYDEKGERLTWLRVTGGALRPKQVILPPQKVNELRIYNGTKYTVQAEVSAGDVCAIPNLTATHPGMGLGEEKDAPKPQMQPVINYTVDLNGEDMQAVLTALQQLADEDPQLHVTWSIPLQEVRVQLMGQVQREILQQLLAERFDLHVAFGAGSILYRETITQACEGVGHFEPLRHYAEVHLLLESGAPGSGLTIATDCKTEVLAKNWQHQVVAGLKAKPQLGVLTGSLLTDVHVTLIGGRASTVHTVGGDFREATWRALRQGLMMLKQRGGVQLLEPWYRFTINVAQAQVGRVMTDIKRMHGVMDPPQQETGSMTTLTGEAPVSEMQDYAQAVTTYTHGQSQLECLIAGYRPCHDAEKVIAARAYDLVSDVANTPGSVFCAHGAGYPVAWDDVPKAAHVAYRYSATELAALSQKGRQHHD